jgi:biofilm protein TabA
MILDNIHSADRYKDFHPLFSKAFEFLKTVTAETFQSETKRIELEGDRLFALIQDDTGKNNEKLEVHQKYIDIQFTYGGNELIGWRSLSECSHPVDPFNTKDDYQLFTDPYTHRFPAGPGEFVIFYPNDAHCPSSGTEPYQKIVIKVQIL